MSDLRLLLFNLMTDESDPLLGFAVGWIGRLAERCQFIDVITMYAGAADLPENVRVFSVGRERGYGKPLRLLSFYRLLLPLLATRRYDACFAHMMPLFAGLAGPLLGATGIPTTLWYTHRQRSMQLRLGLCMSRRAVSADASSFPYATDKLRVIGHGIDTDLYCPPPDSLRQAAEPLVVQVARLAEIKHQASSIQAIAQTGANLALIGGSQAGPPSQYKRQLLALVDRLSLGQRVQFTGDLPARQVRDWLHRACIAVNMSPPGLFDKAALESMACGLPTVVCNPAFAPLLGEHRHLLLTEGPDDVAGLSERLRALCGLSAAERAEIGETLRRNVIARHSLDGLIERLMAVLATGELPPNPK